MIAQQIQQFQQGPYGEILPPPLVGALSPEQALEKLRLDSQRTKSPIESIPKRGESRKGMINLAMLYAHQLNLASAIAGRLKDEDALALRKAVVEEMNPMSLRPLGMENLWFSSFAPILQLLDPNKALWRIGLPDKGRTTTFHAQLDRAIRHAQKIYVQWSEQDGEQWQQWLQQAVRSVKPYYQHLVWLAALTTTPDLSADLGGGYTLQRLGKHSTYRIITPEGERVFETSRPMRAVMMSSAITSAALSTSLRHKRVKMPHYLPGQVVGALVRMGAKRPISTGKTWKVGGFSAKVINKQVIGLTNGKARYGLAQQNNLFRVGKIQGKGSVGQPMGSLLVPAVWTRTDKIRVGLTWAAWAVGGMR